ncbi:hypothetical protein [Haloarchaeobius amylolyticus]|uniref:hypothetical protein n=1 Tax=Haloarchaeobius amylolyticus TaxID=1198296 RepID=UPI00227029AA|nr:hypothetical protein [Haloarchaeobius amylolyticus]
MSGLRRSTNALLTWLLVAGLVVLAVVAYRQESVLWAGLAGVVALLAVVPALLGRSATRVPPWPLLVIAGVPLATRTVGPETLGSTAGDATASGLAMAGDLGLDLAWLVTPALVGQGFETVGTFADAAALAAIALLAVAMLQGFTSLRMTTGFGMLFVLVVTMGLTGFWAVVRWAGADALGVTFVATNETLMHEFAAASLAGFLVAVFFGPYFCRARPRERTQPQPSLLTDGGAGGDHQ